jgi:hypothetical protein
MERVLNQLAFKNVDQQGFQAFSKVYNGFVLFIARVPNSKHWHSSITVRSLEISLPEPTESWLREFDTENR